MTMEIVYRLAGSVALLYPLTTRVIPTLYQTAYDFADGDHLVIGTLGTYLVGTTSFWTFNILFLLSDLYRWPSWMYKYKIQKDQNVPMDMPKFYKALRTSAFNTVIISLVMSVPVYRLQMWLGVQMRPEEVPGPLVIIRDLLTCVACTEFAFYHTHRLIHHPLLYKRIHKKHHEWTAPIGIVSVYATIPEYLFGNVMPVFLGPLVARSHMAVAWVWLIIALFSTVIGHSGYHLPFLNPPEMHDFHHYNFEGCYGSIGIFDWLYGTNKKFLQTPAAKRRKVIYSLTPADDLCPSEAGPYKIIRD